MLLKKIIIKKDTLIHFFLLLLAILIPFLAIPLLNINKGAALDCAAHVLGSYLGALLSALIAISFFLKNITPNLKRSIYFGISILALLLSYHTTLSKFAEKQKLDTMKMYLASMRQGNTPVRPQRSDSTSKILSLFKTRYDGLIPFLEEIISTVTPLQVELDKLEEEIKAFNFSHIFTKQNIEKLLVDKKKMEDVKIAVKDYQKLLLKRERLIENIRHTEDTAIEKSKASFSPEVMRQIQSEDYKKSRRLIDDTYEKFFRAEQGMIDCQYDLLKLLGDRSNDSKTGGNESTIKDPTAFAKELEMLTNKIKNFLTQYQEALNTLNKEGDRIGALLKAFI